VLILASESPRRRDLLQAAGIEFRAVAPGVAEPSTRGARGRCADLVRRAALRKALAVCAKPEETVVGADTIVVCDGEVMGKPVNADEARAMLRTLSGRWHSVYTGIALVRGSDRLVDYERTRVCFRRLTGSDIDRYVQSGEPMGKAGAYAIQGKGAVLVRAVRGCYTNVVGLPVAKLLDMLAHLERPPR
jgi:septum formation protein